MWRDHVEDLVDKYEKPLSHPWNTQFDNERAQVDTGVSRGLTNSPWQGVLWIVLWIS